MFAIKQLQLEITILIYLNLRVISIMSQAHEDLIMEQVQNNHFVCTHTRWF